MADRERLPSRVLAYARKHARAIVLVAILFAIAWPVFSTVQPAYYRRYPGLAERMDHWATSTHSRISCIECHTEPGIGGFVAFAAESVPAFYSQIASGASKTNLISAPSRRACQKCHTDYRTVAPSGDLLIPHRAHVQVLGMSCVECHQNLVHFPNSRGFNSPEMEGCLEKCHDGETASNECLDCHTQKHTPASHADKDWLKMHGEAASSEDCGECHDWTPDYCKDCHSQRPASHVGNWKKLHGPEAQVRGDGCNVCHDVKFCKECH